jgi:hypothetical protein
MMEVGQRRQVYDRGSGNRWYVDITDEFLHERGRHGIDINDPNLNRNGDVIIVEPLDPSQDFVIEYEYVETPGGRLRPFPLNEQIHYGFIVPGLERYNDHPIENDDAYQGAQLENHDPWERPPAAGGRTRRRKSKGKSKCKGKCKVKSKCKKTVKTRKCIRRGRSHK